MCFQFLILANGCTLPKVINGHIANKENNSDVRIGSTIKIQCDKDYALFKIGSHSNSICLNSTKFLKF